MKNILTKLFGRNWRTTLLGWGKGLLIIAADIYTAYINHQFTGLNSAALLLAILVIINGAVAKDARVSGLPGAEVINPKTELEIAQDVLLAAKLTKNQKYIDWCQAAVDALEKAPIAQPDA